MHAYRIHTRGALGAVDASNDVSLSNGLHLKRDNGGFVFIDLPDH